MSSKIEVKRICQVCSKEFIAKKTTTRCCSIECNRKAYKKNIKDFKIEKSNKETSELKFKPLEDLKAREFLSVRQVSKLIGCSRQNVYKLINTGKLKATNILIKKTIVRRADLEMIFNQIEVDKLFLPPQPKIEIIEKVEPVKYDIAECYTLTEVQKKFNIPETTLQSLIKRNNVPKFKKGWFAYVPKTIIDKLLS